MPQDGRFDCGRLPSCPATCVGPNRDLVKLWSSHCSCTAEWLLHSYVLHTLLSLLVYLVLNASRYLYSIELHCIKVPCTCCKS